MMQRFLRDESGMTMGLVVIMIVLIGVMGAGLLVFVSRDLNSVVEVNNGQRALEAADAGIKVAKIRLDRNENALATMYDGVGTDDSQWSYSKSNSNCTSLGNTGMCITDLNGDGNPTDSANVTIQSVSTPANSFKVISTGGYGNAKRRIEAYFSKKPGGSGMPGYYTPGDIVFRRPVGSIPHHDIKIDDLSFFAGRNILIEHFDGLNLVGGDGAPHDATHIVLDNNGDRLGDWNTSDDNPPSYYNTVGRKYGGSTPYTGTGFAAAGYVCKGLTCPNPATDPNSTSSQIVSDGKLSYDRTTGTKGDRLKFAAKTNCTTGAPEPTRNPNGTDCTTGQNLITYPFPRPTPDTSYLRGLADDGLGPNALFTSPPTLAQWQATYPAPTAATSTAAAFRVVFIDLENSANKNVVFGNATSGTANRINTQDHKATNAFGVMVVRCGNLRMNEHFMGIAILVTGTGSGCESTAHYTNSGADTHIGGYVWAEGYRNAAGADQAGIDIAEHVHLETLPDSMTLSGINHINYAYNLLELAYGGTASAGVQMLSWRETY